MEEQGDIDILKKILLEGEFKQSRNSNIWSVFVPQLEFNIRDNWFPLLTTKRIFLKGMVKELLWFLTGDTNSKHLADEGENIWDGNNTREFLDI